MIDIPISALAICYGPLALMIIGFIGFAYLTDVDARRTYLRRMDDRPEDEQPVPDPLPVTRAFNAQTPGGSRVTIAPRVERAQVEIREVQSQLTASSEEEAQDEPDTAPEDNTGDADTEDNNEAK